MITPLFWKNGASARWRNKAIRGTRAEVPLELFCLNYFLNVLQVTQVPFFSCFDCSIIFILNGFIETSFAKSTICISKEVIYYYLIPNLLPSINCITIYLSNVLSYLSIYLTIKNIIILLIQTCESNLTEFHQQNHNSK